MAILIPGKVWQSVYFFLQSTKENSSQFKIFREIEFQSWKQGLSIENLL